METNKQTLERLSNLDLRQYAGDLKAIQGDDRELYERLMRSPVEVHVTAQRGICDDLLYQILSTIEGTYERFEELRREVMFKLPKNSPGWNLLSVLFDGIYVGEPEDLLNHRYNRPEGILYRTRGLGEKVVDITFLSDQSTSINNPDNL